MLDFYRCSYETVSDRWPNILAGMIDHLSQVIDNLPSQGENTSGVAFNPATNLASKVHEGNKILSQIKRLKDRMGKNLELELSNGEISYILNPPFVTSKYQVNSGRWRTSRHRLQHRVDSSHRTLEEHLVYHAMALRRVPSHLYPNAKKLIYNFSQMLFVRSP